MIYKSSLFSGGRGFPGLKQFAVLLRTKDEGYFGNPAKGAKGAKRRQGARGWVTKTADIRG